MSPGNIPKSKVKLANTNCAATVNLHSNSPLDAYDSAYDIQ